MFSSRKHGLARILAGTAGLLVAAVAIWSCRPVAQPTTSTASLTNYPGLQIQPAFSPDGKKVTFAWDGEKRENFDIYVKVVGAGAPLRLTSNPAPEHHPDWSPDGRYIAFCRAVSDHFEIWSIPAQGGAERKLGESAVCEGLSWSPDGKYLALVDKTAPQASNTIFSLSVETGEKGRLTSLPDEFWGDFSPKFSPDGKTLAFRRASSSENNDLYVLSVGVGGKPEGSPRRLTFRKEQISGFDWTADGRRIVFLAGNLWMISASGGTPERLAVTSDDADALSVSRSGSRLVYQRHLFDFNIWRVNLGDPGRKPGNPVPFISSPKEDIDPAVSPNGKRVAFVSGRTGGREIWMCDANGSNSVQLTSFGGTNLFGPRWSPDGKNIAFAAEDGQKPHIYVVSPNGGKPRRLTSQAALREGWPYWSRDGKWLYFTSDRSSRAEIWRMPSKGGEAVQITSHQGAGEQESPDGRYIYYCKGFPLDMSLWRIPVKGGEEVKVIDAMHSNGRWNIARNGIYFFTPPDKEGHSDIRLYEFSTGKVSKILTIERVVDEHIAVSPDSRWILYTQVDDAASDLMLVENYR
jgi:Tol biopolymer transport system component